MKLPKVGFIGAGKVGTTLASLWHQAGYSIVGVYSRRRESSELLAARVPIPIFTEAVDILPYCDLVFLTVPDDAITGVVPSLVTDQWAGKAVVHTSGVSSLNLLQPLAEAGAMIGSLHPAFPFADIDMAIDNLAGVTFAIECHDDVLTTWLHGLVEAIQGHILTIPVGHKATYHAALTIASNYTVTLYAVAERLLMALGAEREIADNALNTLVRATVENLGKQGIPKALTGALTRNDTGTIEAHLDALKHDITLLESYKHLAKLSFPMLHERGLSTELLEQVLEQER